MDVLWVVYQAHFILINYLSFGSPFNVNPTLPQKIISWIIVIPIQYTPTKSYQTQSWTILDYICVDLYCTFVNILQERLKFAIKLCMLMYKWLKWSIDQTRLRCDECQCDLVNVFLLKWLPVGSTDTSKSASCNERRKEEKMVVHFYCLHRYWFLLMNL